MTSVRASTRSSDLQPCACMHACIHAYMHTCIHTYILYIYIYIPTLASVHMYMYVCGHTYACMSVVFVRMYVCVSDIPHPILLNPISQGQLLRTVCVCLQAESRRMTASRGRLRTSDRCSEGMCVCVCWRLPRHVSQLALCSRLLSTASIMNKVS